jgi:mono/diheme cytochrome c family protein
MNKPAWTASAALLGLIVATPVFAADPGQAIYQAHCSACHGANGKGVIPGTQDFTQKGGVLSQSDAVLIDRITQGYQAPGAPMAMPAKGGDPSLTDEQIKQVLAYLRSQFGH